MLDRRILRLTPKRIFCPLCGDWHNWEGKPLQVYSKYDPYKYECNGVTLKFWVDDNCIHIQSSDLCDKVNTYIDDELYLDDIECDLSDPIFYFSIPISTEEIVCSGECDYCDSCNLPNIGDERDDDDDEFELNLEFKFEFASRYFDKYAQSNRDERKKIEEETKREQEFERQREEEARREQELAKQREEEARREQELAKQREEEAKHEQELVKPHETKKTTKNKEESSMEKTTIWEQLYEHAPKENVEIAKEWAKKYKPTLKWAIPVVSIYAAYRILNSKSSNLTIENIDGECEKKLGFGLDFLKDKNALRELMVLGGLSAGAYAAIKTVSAIYKKDDESDLSVEDVEEGMNKLDGAAKKFNWIQPKTEAMLPLATSVIIVYVMTQKLKWFECVKDKANKICGDLSIRATVYLDMAKLFIADKLHIDLNNEEEAQKFKKFVFLAAVVGVGALIYGTKIFGDKAVSDENAKSETDEKLEAFVSQVLSIMEKLLPTAFAGATTFLVTKHVLKAKEDVVDVEVNEESSSSLEKEKAGADFSEEAKSEISESGTEENTSGKK